MSREGTSNALEVAERLMSQSRWVEAVAHLEQAVVARPKHGPTLLMLSRALFAAGAYRRSHELALAASRAGSARWDVLFALARHLAMFGERDAILACLRAPAFRSGAPAQALSEAGVVLSALGENEEAQTLVDLALAREPTHPGSLYFSGNLRMFFGKKQAAAADYERCLKAAPHFAQASWALSGLSKVTAESNHVERMQAELTRAKPGLGAEMYLSFGLFNELNDLGRFDEAWAALERGCASKRAKLRYRHADSLSVLDDLQNTCGASFFKDLPAPTTPAPDAPIFIIGMYRSGTTLLEQILAGHTQVADGGESFSFSLVLRHAADRGSSELISREILQASVNFDYPALGERFSQLTAWRKRGRLRFTEKLPANFALVGHIARALPHARFLHLVRDPVQTCFSNLRVLFGEAAAYSYDQTELAEYYLGYRRLMEHWRQQLPGRILDVPFAELVSETESVAKRVMAFCNLPFEPATLSQRGGERAVTTASAAQVRGALDPGRAEAWRPYARQLLPLRRILHVALPNEVEPPE